MNSDIAHCNRIPVFDFRHIRGFYLTPIHDRDRARACHRYGRFVLHDGGCVLVYANAKQAGVRRNQIKQSAKPVTLTKRF
jgi:hypothetical protein